MPHTAATMMHPGPVPEWAGGDGKAVLASQSSHSTLQSTSSLTRASEESSWGSHLCSSHPHQVESKFLVISKAFGILSWRPKAPGSSEHTQTELWSCVSTADMSSMICYDWTHHLVRWCVLRFPPIPFPLEWPAPRYYPKTLLRSLFHHHEIRIYGVAPVGKQSWDQTKHCIKPCRLKCLYSNSHTNHTYLQGIIVASKWQAIKWAECEVWKRFLKRRKKKKKRKSRQKSCGKLLQQMCLALLWAIFANLRWKCQWFP